MNKLQSMQEIVEHAGRFVKDVRAQIAAADSDAYDFPDFLESIQRDIFDVQNDLRQIRSDLNLTVH